MKKLFFILISLCITAIAFAASGTSYTFTATSGTYDSNVSYSTTQNGGQTAPQMSSSQLRLYAKNQIIFTPSDGVTITAITIACSTSSYVGGSWSASTGSASTSEANITWSGSATSELTLTNGSTAGAARMKSVTITYEAGSTGGDDPSATYVKATSTSNLCDGAKVIIVASGYDFALSEEQRTANRGQYAITKEGNNVTWSTSSVDVAELTLGITAGGKYTFKTNNNKYLYASSSSANELKAQDINNADGEWSISFADGVATITATGTNTRNVMQYNQTSSIFACYSTASQKSLAIYVKDGDCGSSCTPITPSLSYTSSVLVGGNLSPTLTGNTGNGTVTYTIKSGTGAMVNSSTGLLTATAPGSVVVQATIAANGAYCESSATSGTITINAPSYTVTAQSNNPSLGSVSGTTTIIATPNACVGYASPAYTVTAGSATVSQDGNTFTVTPSSDCTVRINFAEQAHDTYLDNVQGTDMTGNYCGSYSAPAIADKTTVSAASQTGDCATDHYHFVGWVKRTITSGQNTEPLDIVKAGTSMTADGSTYRAVWAKEAQ